MREAWIFPSRCWGSERVSLSCKVTKLGDGRIQIRTLDYSVYGYLIIPPKPTVQAWLVNAFHFLGM